MKCVTSKQKIGVFGHYGNRNLGDESIITAVIENIRSRVPEADVIGFSLRPLDTAARHGIPAYSIIRQKNGINFAPPGGELVTEMPSSVEIPLPPLRVMGRIKQRLKRLRIIGPLLVFVRRSIDVAMIVPAELKFLRSSYTTLKDIDLLIFSGSNQFLDNFGGTWHFPYNVLKWSTMAKITGTRIAFASVGAGPLDGRLSKLFHKWAASKADYVSFRDIQSRNIMVDAGFRGNGQVCPDLAHSLRCPDSFESNPKSFAEGTNRRRMGLNPMPIYDKRYWCDADDDLYSDYIDKLVALSGKVISEGYLLSFFSMQPRDFNVIEDVVAGLKEEQLLDSSSEYSIDVAHTVDQVVDIMSNYDLIVATRFHGVVLSLVLNKPTIGICYGKKTEEVLVDMGQSDYYSYFEDFSASDLMSRIHKLEQNKEKQTAKIVAKSVVYQDSLNRQYDTILGLLANTTISGR
jgi:polysaccharide pyruvyl transferase WcaK-like protein